MKRDYQCWGDGSIGKVRAMQAGRLKLQALALTCKAGHDGMYLQPQPRET